MSDKENVRISPRTGKPIDEKHARGGKKTGQLKRAKAKKSYPNKSRNGKNSPVIGMNGYNLKEGDNTKVMLINLELFNMPDIDLDDIEQVNRRLGEYFALYAKHDFKPTVAGMALALNGMSRQMLWAIAYDKPTGSDGYKAALPFSVTESIKKAYKMMENMWETYMNSGKINPVSGIFLGKNNYGYTDKQEHVITPNAHNDADFSAEEIKERYLPKEE